MTGITQEQFEQAQALSTMVAANADPQAFANGFIPMMSTPIAAPFNDFAVLPYSGEIYQEIADLMASGDVHAAGYTADNLQTAVQGIITTELTEHLKTPGVDRTAAIDQIRPLVEQYGDADALTELDASRQQIVFLEALGATDPEINSLIDDPSGIQAVIGAHSTEDLLNGFDAVGGADAAELTAYLRGDPEIADALKGAIVGDPTMLPGLMRLSENGRFEQLGEFLADQDPDSPLAGIARTRVLATLNSIENDPAVTFVQFEGLIDIAGGFDFGALLQFFTDIMDGHGVDFAVNNLVDNLGVTGEQADAVRYFGGMAGSAVDLMVGGTNAPGGFWHAQGGNITGGLSNAWRHAGNLIGGGVTATFEVDTPATVTYDVTSFSASFDTATAGIDYTDGVSPAEWSQTWEAVKDIAPSTEAEMAAINNLATTDPAVQAQFNSLGAMTQDEVRTEVLEMMDRMANADPATGVTATPREVALDFGT